MTHRLEPDRGHPGAFTVLLGTTAQSYVDPGRPLHLEFEYVQRIAEALDATVLARPEPERIRVVHLGGAGMTLPRYVEARRPHTAQIVCEPDGELLAEVRRKLPLPDHSGIKVRELPGREALQAMPVDYADALVLDAFAAAQVPACFAGWEFWELASSRLRSGGVLIANITDQAPHAWAKRFVAGVAGAWLSVAVSAEPGVWKGRRFGNLVVVASAVPLPVARLESEAHRAAFPHRLISGRELRRWLGGAQPFTDADATPSPEPPGGASWFS